MKTIFWIVISVLIVLLIIRVILKGKRDCNKCNKKKYTDNDEGVRVDNKNDVGNFVNENVIDNNDTDKGEPFETNDSINNDQSV